jgi:hypothetical protein
VEKLAAAILEMPRPTMLRKYVAASCAHLPIQCAPAKVKGKSDLFEQQNTSKLHSHSQHVEQGIHVDIMKMAVLIKGSTDQRDA